MTREKAIKIVKEFINGTCLHLVDQEALETLIPELAESEDEKIRKFLIDLVSTMNWRVNWPEDKVKEEKAKCIAYLENLKEQKPNFDTHWENGSIVCEQKEQKPSINIDQLKSLMLQYLQEAANEKDDLDIEADTDKWARKILGYDFEQKPVEWEWPNLSNCIKNCKKCHGKCFYRKEPYEEQKPADDVSKEEYGRKFKGLCDAYETKPHTTKWMKEMIDEKFKELVEEYHEQKPADLSTMMVHKEPYIAPVPTPMVADEQKSEWSDEDEKRLKQLIYDTEHIRAEYEKKKEKLGEDFNNSLIKDCDEQISWLKSLPGRFNLEPKQEWSEEDDRIRQKLIHFISSPNVEGFMLASDERMFVSWLKSLRPMPKVAVADGQLWKPSEEQLNWLNIAKNIVGDTGQVVLKSLYNDLKKL